MKKQKIKYEMTRMVFPIEEDGTINLHATAAGEDWLRAGRLREAAEKGDVQAAKELESLEEDVMFFVDDVPDEE